MPNEKRPLKVFLCHAHADKDKARELYRFLKRRGLQPWLDAEDLLPGQNRQVEIPRALEGSDAIIILLSKTSVDKEGYVQKEIKFALDKALEMPEGRIFIIPARLEECDVPRSLSTYQWVDLFDEGGYDKLMKSLRLRAEQLNCFSIDILTIDDHDIEMHPELNTKQSLNSFVIDGLNWRHAKASVIFDDRLRSAFPGLRGIEIFDGENAVKRLKVLLREPLVVDSSVDGQETPFWWLRGTANMPIEKFVLLDERRVLMDTYELNIEYIVAVREFNQKERNFVYVQVRQDEPTGLYDYSQDRLKSYLQHQLDENYGYYYYEQYAIWKDKLIRREEFDDGATVIDGKPVDIKGAELRERYITPYNLIICGKDHVLNSGKTDDDMNEILDGILLGTKTIYDLVILIGSLRRLRLSD